MHTSFRTIVLFLQLISHLVANRPYGSVIYDINLKYGVEIGELRKLEKLAVKRKKADLDTTFLKNCKLFNVIPNFLLFNIPYGSTSDLSAIRKRLLRNALTERLRDKRKLDSSYSNQCLKIKSIVSSLDWYIINRCVNKNVLSSCDQTVRRHDKKLRNLTKNQELPFTSEQTIKNLSSYTLSDKEKDILKYGLKFGLPPSSKVTVTDIASSFESVNSFLTSNLKDGVTENEVKAELSSLAQSYCASYRPSGQALKKHAVLKRLRRNKEIVICKPDNW